MNRIFTKDFIRQNLDCYNKQSKIKLPIIINALEELSEPITLRNIFETVKRTEDKFWWLMVHTDITIPELKEIGLKIADVAVRIYEEETGGNKRLSELFSLALQGKNTEDELKQFIKEGDNSASRAENSIKAVARAVAAQYTEGHKRPLVLKASQRLSLAAYKNELYTGWVNEILLSYVV